MMGLWGGGIFLSTLLLPADAAPAPQRGAPVTLRDLMPSVADYIAAFRLFAIPALAFVMLISVARHVGAAIQGSFYVVYLEGIGVSGTVIGLMMTAAGVLGLAGSLSAAPMLRFAASHWLLLWTTVATLVFVVITPLLEDIPLLLAASGIRGWALAASLVFLISLISRWAGPGVQGKAMGLRVTVNQLTSVIVPVVMGAVVEVAGIEASFYVVGVAALVMIVLSGLWARRSRAFD
jgi:predicted MFS family arabinose efflux permease